MQLDGFYRKKLYLKSEKNRISIFRQNNLDLFSVLSVATAIVSTKLCFYVSKSYKSYKNIRIMYSVVCDRLCEYFIFIFRNTIWVNVHNLLSTIWHIGSKFMAETKRFCVCGISVVVLVVHRSKAKKGELSKKGPGKHGRCLQNSKRDIVLYSVIRY